MTSVTGSEPRYLAEGREAERLLNEGRVAEAIGILEALLAASGDVPGYGRVVLHERLGRALLRAGDHEAAVGRLRQGLELAGRLAPTGNVHRLRCSLRSGLGDALRAAGRPVEARRAYLAALEIGRDLRDPRSQAVDHARLGALALAQGDAAEARERYGASLDAVRELREPKLEAGALHQLGLVLRQLGEPAEAARRLEEAAGICEAHGDLAAADRSWSELIALHREAGNPPEAERWCRRAVEGRRRLGPSLVLVRRLVTLVELLSARPERRDEARAVAREALALAQALDPLAAEAWALYGLLGTLEDIAEYRELGRRAPGIVAAAQRLEHAPGLGHAVLAGRIGRCLCAGGRPDLAVAPLRAAVQEAEALPAGIERDDLLDMLRADLQRALGVPGDTPGAAPADVSGTPDAAILVTEHVATDYAFDPDLLLQGPRSWTDRPAGDAPALPDDARPILALGARTWQEAGGRIRFALPAEEPEARARDGCTVLRHVRRRVSVGGDPAIAWRLLELADGTRSRAGILDSLPEGDRPAAAGLLDALAHLGVLDASGRPFGRFLHWATRKGVLPAGGLEGDETLLLATEAEPPPADASAVVTLGTEVPEALRDLHALTRRRRSTRDYRGAALTRGEFDALLETACGVTGSFAWAGREVKLRAYPSSGALYAVAVHPVVFRVEGLDPAVYRYDAERHALLPAPGSFDPERFVAAALPMEREMVAGVAVLFCLTGRFPRHERKYGEGGYRMLVAEAGHVSHNLVLAATALGLAARPFGGVFDGAINRELGLDQSREQFLLSVVVGR